MKRLLTLWFIRSISKSMSKYTNTSGDRILHMLYIEFEDLHFRGGKK